MSDHQHSGEPGVWLDNGEKMDQIQLSNEIPVPKLLRSGRRSISLEIRPDGQFIVRAPRFATEEMIREFISSKRKWIDKTYSRTHEQIRSNRPKEFVESERFLYLGNEYPLHIAGDMYGKLLFEDKFILNAKYLSMARTLFERWYREEAFMLFTLRSKFYAASMGVRYNSITLSGAKHRWGSCYPGGKLRFNWRLIMAPREIIDYVVVHELAHIREPNHSRRFWAVVESWCPDQKQSRRWLRQNASWLQRRPLPTDLA